MSKQHLDRTQSVHQAWTTRNPVATKTKGAVLRQAIANADWAMVERFAGLNVVMEKIVQSEQENPASNGPGMIDDFRLWWSRRCRQMGRYLSDGGVAV